MPKPATEMDKVGQGDGGGPALFTQGANSAVPQWYQDRVSRRPRAASPPLPSPLLASRPPSPPLRRVSVTEETSNDLRRHSGFSAPPVKRPESSRAIAITRYGDTGIPEAPYPTGFETYSGAYAPTISPETGGLHRHIYERLCEGQFRLAMIHPARRHQVRCEIITRHLDTPTSYAAISYAWGDPGNTEQLWVGSQSMAVSVSLYEALRAMRQRDKAVWVWADALCINQEDSVERAQQVQLMTRIYSGAKSVAIWLGPAADDSDFAVQFLQNVAKQVDSTDGTVQVPSADTRGIPAAACLFQRRYWRRLWVVQEVRNAKTIMVYCGTTVVPWQTYHDACTVFRRIYGNLYTSLEGQPTANNQLSQSQILRHEGPNSIIPISTSQYEPDDGLLLHILRRCRPKVCADPRDKVYGILGILPEELRDEVRPDYKQPVKQVYAEVVDIILNTTGKLDVICDAIHFPPRLDLADFPSFVPDWSQMPGMAAMGEKHRIFTASGTSKARFRFEDRRLNKLEIEAIHIGSIKDHGIAVATFSRLNDYLMAFLQWRAILLGAIADLPGVTKKAQEEDFCRVLSLGILPSAWDKRKDGWLSVCYHLFSRFLVERLPFICMDTELKKHAEAVVGIGGVEPRRFIQVHFGEHMMGRCFCIDSHGRLGMGTGAMARDDIVVIPLGCSTPILLREEGPKNEYRFVGDVYIHGYMKGRAVSRWKEGKLQARKYVLH